MNSNPKEAIVARAEDSFPRTGEATARWPKPVDTHLVNKSFWMNLFVGPGTDSIAGMRHRYILVSCDKIASFPSGGTRVGCHGLGVSAHSAVSTGMECDLTRCSSVVECDQPL